jgi:hypothetical protein
MVEFPSSTKFIRIKNEDLPNAFYVDDANNYYLRFRVRSEDGTTTSRWSQKFEIPMLYDATDIATDVTHSGAVTSINGKKVVSVTWNVDKPVSDKKLFTKRFHVYGRFYSTNGDTTTHWQFLQEVNGTNFSSALPANTSHADIMVLLPTFRGINASADLGRLPDDSGIQTPDNLFPKSKLFQELDLK